ncbi:MAG: 30S ribosomal protein S12 methylthiotransferase RimO [Planctomycetota bacterium]|jgi:ribosomal protein S12 methylthiotransferase
MSRPKRVAFVSLGCAKNLVDSEKMLGQIVEAGYHVTADEADADVVVVNTCGFLSAAREEALEVIQEVAELKRTGPCQRVVVTGCLVQRDGESLLDRVAGVDALVGVNNRDDVVRAVLGNHGKNTRGPHQVDRYLGDYYPRVDDDTARLRITPRHYAYLRISEGCDRKCTFCTIPSIRGPMHSKPPEAILAEARELAGDGAVELNLIGQDTTSYGADIGYEPGLAGLLRRLDAELDQVAWIRLMYAYPSVMTDEIINAVAQCDRLVKYIDVPLQHINDRVLKAMHRCVDRRTTELLLEKIRRTIPGVAIRTTLIAGFPGETDAEFAELLDFLRAFKFDALGVFAFSPEPDTPAGRMAGQLPEEVKQQRVDALMTAQQEMAFELADQTVGRRFEVLVEGPPSDGLVPARHAGQAPEVDAVTWLQDAGVASGRPADDSLAPGRFVPVRCTGRRDYDLLATPTDVALPVLGSA